MVYGLELSASRGCGNSRLKALAVGARRTASVRWVCARRRRARGDGECDVASVVFLDQPEREIDARRHARRGVEVAVLHVDRVECDLDVRKALGELADVGPMRRHAAARDETRGSQDERAGAHRAEAAGSPTQALELA